jgi:hypothetical protein
MNEDEEAWAFRKLTAAYSTLTGSSLIDPEHNLPTGMWPAMKWAIEYRAASSAV